MALPQFVLALNATTSIGKFTYKFDAGLVLSVQWRADVGYIPLRQLPALSASATVTIQDMQQAQDFMLAFEAQPYNWGY